MRAQGIATAAVRGTVRSDNGSDLDGARVRVINIATGVASYARVRGGRFLVQGLETGGPYIVEVRHLGFEPRRSAAVRLALGESREIAIVMDRVAVALEPVLLSATASTHGASGGATLVPASLVQRLPTPNRNFYDFVRLAPQISTKVGSQRTGVSAAGANFRFNNFLINGADERFVNGNVSAAFNMGKAIPIDAVREFQVLLAPYDVRYGDFAGALVNTVTQSGTNEFHGSAFTYWRSDRLDRGGELASGAPYDRLQYGLSLGGPVWRDRMHFFIATELQHLTSPASGPHIGQPSSSIPPVPVSESDLVRLDEIMRGYGLTAGSPGLVRIDNPLRNLFLRLDAAIPSWRSRAFAFVNYVGAEDHRFSRSVQPDTFSLSSYRYAGATGVRLTSMQLHTDLPRTNGGHNELTVSQLSDWVDFVPDVHQPIVRVLVPGTGGGLVVLNTGTAELAQGRFDRSWSVSVKDEISLPVSAHHLVVLGAQVERFRVKRGGITGAYGAWTFSSLDALENGVAERYELRKDFGSADAPLPGVQYSVYLGDEWRRSDRLSMTSGVRFDVMHFGAHAPANAEVDSIFGRRTDQMPRERVHISPRLGFAWDVFGAGRDKLRGGLGVFTGRPPRAWIRPAITNYGVGIGQLRCGQLASPQGLTPPFVPDYRAPPSTCAGGEDLQTVPRGDVDLLDSNLRMAQSLRGSLAWDRQMPWGITVTTEALASRYRSDFMFVNLNLSGPQGADRFGRVLYGANSASGVPTPARRSQQFAGVIDLVNTAKNYSYQLSTRLERRFAQGTAASASYTYSRTRDVQSPSRVNMSGTAMWGDARALSGRHDDIQTGISLNDLPHRVVMAVAYAAPWRRWSTEISLFYVGESGSPFTYVATGTRGQGDLNADGSNSNDPIYVPRDARVASEIAFSGRSDAGADNSPVAKAQRIQEQQNAFEQFIEGSSCLRGQRGRILARNSCREPWSQTTIAAVHQVISVGRYRPDVSLEIFNVLNLLNGAWGRYRLAAPRLLEQVAPEVGGGESTFRFDATRRQWTLHEAESPFQLQLGVRYRF